MLTFHSLQICKKKCDRLAHAHMREGVTLRKALYTGSLAFVIQRDKERFNFQPDGDENRSYKKKTMSCLKSRINQFLLCERPTFWRKRKMKEKMMQRRVKNIKHSGKTDMGKWLGFIFVTYFPFSIFFKWNSITAKKRELGKEHPASLSLSLSVKTSLYVFTSAAGAIPPHRRQTSFEDFVLWNVLSEMIIWTKGQAFH